MRCLWACSFALSAVFFVACNHSGGDGSISQQIGATGGTLTGTGSLAGVVLTIANGALSTETQITATPVSSQPAAGFSATGIAVRFGPDGMTFNPPATLTLPYDPSKVPAGADPANTIVEHLTSAGVHSQLTPTSVDTANHRVTLAISGFSTYWTSVPTPGSGGETIDTTQYVFFGATGVDQYHFEDDTYLQLHSNSQFFPRPPFPNLDFLVLQHADPNTATYEDWLMTREPNGDLLQYGLDHTGAESFVEVNAAAAFLPGSVVTGRASTSSFDYDGYQVPNLTTVAYTGHTNFSAIVNRASPMSTPAGTFEDVIEVVFTDDWTEQPTASGHDVTTIYFARSVGPVAYRVGAGSLVKLMDYALEVN